MGKKQQTLHPVNVVIENPGEELYAKDYPRLTIKVSTVEGSVYLAMCIVDDEGGEPYWSEISRDDIDKSLALQKEIQDRIDADQVLQSNIDALASALDSAIQEVQSSIDATNAAIQAEAEAREAAINEAMAAEAQERDNAINAAIQAEAEARDAAIAAINEVITAESEALNAAINEAIAAEVEARDAAISEAITAEVEARDAAINELEEKVTVEELTENQMSDLLDIINDEEPEIIV